MRLLKAINWPVITYETFGFFLGLMIGVNVGFIFAFFYIFFPWGVP